MLLPLEKLQGYRQQVTDPNHLIAGRFFQIDFFHVFFCSYLLRKYRSAPEISSYSDTPQKSVRNTRYMFRTDIAAITGVSCNCMDFDSLLA